MADRQSGVKDRPLQADGNVSSDQTATSDQSERSLIVHPQTQSSGFFSRFRNHIFAAGFAFLLSPLTFLWLGESPVDPTNYAERTRRVLRTTP